MKPNFTHITLAIAFVFSTAWLPGKQALAVENQESPLTPAQAQQLSRDLIPSPSQEFFQQGREMLEKEIQLLNQRQNTTSEPPLQINVEPQTELDRLPQLQPTQSQ
jgi:hypothetical protein